MNPNSPILLAHRSRPGPGGALILRLALRWCLCVLVFVSLGLSMRMALLPIESAAPALRAVASGVSTARSVLARAGILDPFEFPRML